MWKIKKSHQTKGIIGAVGVAISQGLEGVIFTFLGLFFTYEIFISPGFSIGALTIKELITFLLLFLLMKPSRIWKLTKRSVLNKEMRIFLIAGIIGTTLGNLFYLMAVQMGGAGYGVILTSLYPVFSMLLIHFFTKDKSNSKMIIGMVIAVISAILFTLVPTLVSGESFTSIKIMGIVLGAVAALFWAIEGFLIHVGLSKKANKNLSANDIVAIRCVGTTFTTIVLLSPIFALINLGLPSWQNPYIIMKNIFIKPEVLLIILAVAINLVILRKLHVWSISQIGARLTAIIDTNNFLITPLVSIFLAFANLTFYQSELPLFEAIPWWSWLLIIPILVGVYIVLINHDNPQSEEIEKVRNV